MSLEIPKAKHRILRDIEIKYAQPVGKTETGDILSKIRSGSIVRDGILVELPPENSPDFEKASLQDLNEEDLKWKLSNIFGVTHDTQKSVYILSEEVSISPAHFTKFPFESKANM